MSDEIQRQLRKLQKDHECVVGQPFKHFVCPILLIDEEIELCMGHVVNQVFRSSTRTTIVQRSDVDAFFGSRFEADFYTLVRSKGKSLSEILFDNKLNREVRPRLSVDGKNLAHYRYEGHKPKEHALLRMEASDGKSMT